MKRYRAFYVIAAAACLAMAATACGKGNSTAAGSSGKCTVVFGANTEVSGDMQTYGAPAAQGLEAAAKNINAAGGVKVGNKHCKFVAEIADNRSDPSDVYTATQQVVDAHAIAALGPDLNDDVAYAAYKKAGVIDFAVETDLAADLANHPKQYPLLVSMIPDSFSYQYSDMLRTIQAEPSIKTVALIYPDDELGQSSDQLFVQILKRFPQLKLVANVSFPDGTSDYSTFLTKIRQAHPDLLLSGATSEDDPVIIQQAAGLGVAKYYESQVMTAQSVLALHGLGNTPVLLTTFAPTYSTAETLPGQHPSVIFGHGPVPLVPGAAIVLYYAAYIVKQAVTAAGSLNPQAVFKHLVGQSYTGPFGTCAMVKGFMDCSIPFITVVGKTVKVENYLTPDQAKPSATYICISGVCKTSS